MTTSAPVAQQPAPGSTAEYEQWVSDGRPVAQQPPHDHVAVTWDAARTRILAVTLQDAEGRVLCVIDEAPDQQPQAERTWLTDQKQTKERQFAEFLNDRRNMNVSAVFHDLMGKFAALSAPQQAEAVPPDLVQAVDALLSEAPCDCKPREHHLSGCHLFDLDIARNAMIAAAPKGQP